MTISTSLLFSRAVDLMSKQQTSLAEMQEKVATGKELVRPSDAPDLAVNIARIKATLGEIDAFKNSLNSVNDRLTIEESYLGSSKDVLIRLKQLALQGSNGTMTGRDRDVIALEVDELIAEMKNLANGTDANGNFLFAGSRVATMPYQEDDDGIIRYQGDNFRPQLDYTQQRRSEIGRNGLDVFKPILTGDQVGAIPAQYTVDVSSTFEVGDQFQIGIEGRQFTYEVKPGDELENILERLNYEINEAVRVSGNNPVLIDSFLKNALEVDVDALSDGTDTYIAGIMEHIEEAGIHSGDSACALPPQTLSKEIIDEIVIQTKKLAKSLNVIGFINIQFAIQNKNIFILEVNPRGSRTIPFVAKSIGIPLAKIASKIMVGKKLSHFNLTEPKTSHIAVKEAVFPFARFPGTDVILGPEMKSTGEVMGIGSTFGEAFAKSQLGANVNLPKKGEVFISVKDDDKQKIIPIAKKLVDLGFTICATSGSAETLNKNKIKAKYIKKVVEGRPNIVDAMLSNDIQLVINTSEGVTSIKDSFSLRQTALLNKIPYYTTLQGANAASLAIKSIIDKSINVKSIQSYFE